MENESKDAAPVKTPPTDNELVTAALTAGQQLHHALHLTSQLTDGKDAASATAQIASSKASVKDLRARFNAACDAAGM